MEPTAISSANLPPATPIRGCDESKVLSRLEDQISWYDKKSMQCQRWFKFLKATEMFVATLIPLFAGFAVATDFSKWTPYVTGSLGLLVVFMQSMQNLNQYQNNWIVFRSTCEELKHEKYLYQAKAAHYTHTDDPCRMLAERVESLVSREHAKWQPALQTTNSAIRPQQS